MSAEEDALVALKARCVEGETQEEHDTHAAELVSAYKAFQERAGDVSPSNPAEGETAIEAHVVVDSAFNQ